MMSDSDKIKGPASYFPSIEEKYGFPVQHGFDLLKRKKEIKHLEMVAWLKKGTPNWAWPCECIGGLS